MKNFNTFQTITPSYTPNVDINKITPRGQSPERRGYRAGYEHYLSKMPVLHPNDEILDAKVAFTKVVMQDLATNLQRAPWLAEKTQTPYEFARTILALEPPSVSFELDPRTKEGTEILVAHWGEGHTSPIHGHADGYMHEAVISGRMRVNTYRITDMKRRRVRPLETSIVGPGLFASKYHMPSEFVRANLVHNFTALEPSHTLHYLPEHTRDGADNMFTVEHFDFHHSYDATDVTQMGSHAAMYLPIGEVLLVRSSNVPEYGDHYMVITGPPELKAHGLRPKDVAIGIPLESNFLLNQFEPRMGVTLLRLKPYVRDAFHQFHGIEVKNNVINFPVQ